MQHNEPQPGGSPYTTFFISAGVWVINGISWIDKSTVTFLLSTVVSILAIVNISLQIFKNSKKSDKP